jgi:hypothetical protein
MMSEERLKSKNKTGGGEICWRVEGKEMSGKENKKKCVVARRMKKKKERKKKEKRKKKKKERLKSGGKKFTRKKIQWLALFLDRNGWDFSNDSHRKKITIVTMTKVTRSNHRYR